DDEVLGVVVEGTARAYSVRALSNAEQFHVVNDVLHDVPVSVTFCDKTSCAKVFTSPSPRKPLAIGVGGFAHGQMMLIVDGQRYYQESLKPFPMWDSPSAHLSMTSEMGTGKRKAGAFPYQSLPFTRTKWKTWKEAYPTTDVYVGAVWRRAHG